MSEDQFDPRIAAFIARLSRLDPGGRARLKRSAGKPLAQARDALGLFYSVLPYSVPPEKEDMYFLVATLFPLADEGGKGDFGAALHRAQKGKNLKGLDRRVEILLDADETQLPFRLRQAIQFLRANRVRVDWPRLLDDLLRWKYSSRPVQRQWARSYFAES